MESEVKIVRLTATVFAKEGENMTNEELIKGLFECFEEDEITEEFGVTAVKAEPSDVTVSDNGDTIRVDSCLDTIDFEEEPSLDLFTLLGKEIVEHYPSLSFEINDDFGYLGIYWEGTPRDSEELADRVSDVQDALKFAYNLAQDLL